MIKNLIKKRNIDLLDNFDFENANYKKIIKPMIQDDLSYCYLNKFEMMESLYVSHYDSFMNNLKNEIDSKNLSGEKNQFFNPRLFGVIKSVTFNIPLWSGLMIKICQDKLKKSFNYNKSSAFFSATRLSNNIVENHIENMKNKLLKKRKNLMPSEILSPIYNNIKVNYNEFYKDLFDNPDMNFVTPSKTLKEIWKPKYSEIVFRVKKNTPIKVNLE